MNYYTDKSMKVYNDVKSGIIETVGKANSRASIKHFERGVKLGFKRGRKSVKIERGQNLFNVLHSLGVIALQSEMDEVINAVKLDNDLK